MQSDFCPNCYAVTLKHLRMLGKDEDREHAKQLLTALVKDNPKFPDNEEADFLLESFFSAVHYGSVEMRSSTLIAHTRAFTNWLDSRFSMNSSQTHRISSESTQTEKATYDPSAPLDASITKERAKAVMQNLVDVYGIKSQKDAERLMNIPNWEHYVSKLKDRAAGRA